MIIPQMQQRYTGYSSEGANNLLSAVKAINKGSEQIARNLRLDATVYTIVYAGVL